MLELVKTYLIKCCDLFPERLLLETSAYDCLKSREKVRNDHCLLWI